MTKDDLSREIMLDITSDGAVFTRKRGTGPSPHGGLVFFSTDTEEEARSLIVLHCRLARDRSGVYRLNDFDAGNADDIDFAADTFRKSYEKAKAKAAEKNTIYARVFDKAYEMLASLGNQGKTGIALSVSESEALSAAGYSANDVHMADVRAALERNGLVVKKGRICPPLKSAG